MRLIAGLGNTGPQYAKTRHNLGFLMLEKYTQEAGFTFQDKSKLQAQTAEQSGSEKAIFAKPTTMMNLSGHSVSAIANYYQINPRDILVIHDEIDLGFGQIRIQFNGGSAGHNGIKSVTAHMGKSFWRVRVGIANQHTPDQEAENFVLSNFSREEAGQLPDIYQKVKPIIDKFAQGEELEATTLTIQ